MAEVPPPPPPSLKLNDGTTAPILAFGTGAALMKPEDDNQTDPTRVARVQAAVRAGFRHLDCAEAYYTEREVGVAIAESGVPREKLFVTSKALGFAPVGQSLDASLGRLGVDYVDLYLLHLPWFDVARPIEEAWKEMEAVKAAGKARSIGVSNFLIPHLEKIIAAGGTLPSVNNLEYSLYLQRRELVDYCRKHGIAVTAFAPVSPCTVAKGGPVDGLLGKLAGKYGVSEADICLRWCFEKGLGVVTTSFNEKRLEGYVKTADAAFKLTAEEVEELDKVGNEKHFRKYFGDKFEEGDRS